FGQEAVALWMERGLPRLPERGERLPPGAWLARGELDDRDRPVCLGRVSAVCRVRCENEVSERPEPAELSLVADHRGPHRNPAEPDVGVCSEIVEPSGVSSVALL